MEVGNPLPPPKCLLIPEPNLKGRIVGYLITGLKPKVPLAVPSLWGLTLCLARASPSVFTWLENGVDRGGEVRS